MSLVNLPIERKPKPPEPVHPWARTIKEHYANKIKCARNSVRNFVYCNPKEKIPSQKRVTFTVIGNRVTKEFIYCANLVQGMHKYRWKTYGTPIIKGCTGVEWGDHLHKIKIKYGSLACALQSQVVVLCDNEWIGGEKELKDLIESKYIYHLALSYQKEGVKNFAYYLKSSSRPCAYMHISIDGEPIGSLLFMLYSDVVPTTCENFLRLCKARRGGYSGTPIHRVVKDGWIQGGGFGLKNNINMDCENFIVPHDKRGVLGMANADRHIDCSTQFYVLLQPNDWLTACHRFVAFGQLIDGEETLKKIEEVETYYESPTANIVIYSAGVVNLDCHDIIINKGTIAYLDGHIEDLVTIGELFYEMLMEQVFLELEFKIIQKLSPTCEDESKYGDAVRDDVKFDSYSTRSKDEDKNYNNDFDVEIYSEYDPEATNTRVTPLLSQSSPIIKETKPYFIALTDVPYPGEVDSNFDLKRLLQGDYCLEADLDPKICIKDRDGLRHKDRIQVISEIIDNQYRDLEDLEMDISSERSSIDSDEVREFQDYLRNYGEHVSFSGMRVKSVAQKLFRTNPIETKGQQEKFSDEDIRIIRSAFHELKTKKKVTISAQESSLSHTQIMRRQTGFVRPGDIVKLRSYYHDRDIYKNEDEEEAEEEDEEKAAKSKRMVFINSESLENIHRIKRKQTAYIRPEDVARTLKERATAKVEEEEEEYKKPTAYQSTVRITSNIPTEYSVDSRRSPSTENKKIVYDHETKNRSSALGRLFDEVTVKDDETLPTLKDYKPLVGVGRKTLKLALSDTDFQESAILVRSPTAQLLRQSMEENTSDKKIEMKHIIEEHPIVPARAKAKKGRTLRPSITVSQYRKMNEDIRVELKRNDVKKEELSRIKEEIRKIKEIENKDIKLYKGSLRLPGDTPAYSPVSLLSTSKDYLLG